LPDLDFAEYLSGRVESHCNASAGDHLFERGGHIIIWLEQEGPGGIHVNHVEVASSANAKAFVPASTTPE
jgi:hypothetical protein